MLGNCISLLHHPTSPYKLSAHAFCSWIIDTYNTLIQEPQFLNWVSEPLIELVWIYKWPQIQMLMALLYGWAGRRCILVCQILWNSNWQNFVWYNRYLSEKVNLHRICIQHCHITYQFHPPKKVFVSTIAPGGPIIMLYKHIQFTSKDFTVYTHSKCWCIHITHRFQQYRED